MPAQSVHDTATDELRIETVAEMLGCSVRTVNRIQADGTLTPIYYTTLRGRKTRRFKRADVEDILTRRAS